MEKRIQRWIRNPRSEDLDGKSLFNFEGLCGSKDPKDLQVGEQSSAEYGGVAQLGEHLLCKQGVIGSIPFISTRAVRLNKGS